MTPISADRLSEWIGVLGGFLTPIIAVVVAYIAYQQMRTNSRRLTLDLFDRRFEIYAACRNLILDVSGRQRNIRHECFMEFDGEIQPAEFLLESEAREYIATLRSQALKLVGIEEELEDEPEQARRDELLGQRRELWSWFRNQVPELTKAFSSSLKLSVS